MATIVFSGGHIMFADEPAARIRADFASRRQGALVDVRVRGEVLGVNPDQVAYLADDDVFTSVRVQGLQGAP